ncbi:MAG: glycosyltransferase family 4 protein [Blastocatellia bacterium]
MTEELEQNSVDKPEKRRLWVVSELYYPEETSTGYYMTRIAEGLADDFDVKVICGQPNYSKKGTTAPKREIHKNVEIFRAAGTRLDKNVIPLRLINMLTHSIAVLGSGLKRFRKGDRIFVVTTPPSLPLIVTIASLFKGSSYTLLIHDNYPELAIASGKMKASSFAAKLTRYLNRWTYKYAAKIIVVGRDMQVLVGEKTKGLDIPITFIPNWAELDAVSPAPRGDNKLLKELDLSDKFVLLYAGNMGYPNDVESIVECARELSVDSGIHFLFLGTGAKRKWLEDAVYERKLENVTLLDPRPREDQQNFLNACDVAIVSLVDGMLGVSMPSRTYNVLAAGKPILAIADSESEVAMLVNEEQVGWVVPPSDPFALAAAIKSIASQSGDLKDIRQRARKAAEAKYSISTAISAYRQEL